MSTTKPLLLAPQIVPSGHPCKSHAVRGSCLWRALRSDIHRARMPSRYAMSGQGADVKRLCVFFAVVVVALAVFSCRGSGGIPKEQVGRMQKLADLVGVAFSKEDWHAAYKLYPPSIRKSCSEDDYIKSVTAAADYRQAGSGRSGSGRNYKKAAADGYDLTSISRSTATRGQRKSKRVTSRCSSDTKTATGGTTKATPAVTGCPAPPSEGVTYACGQRNAAAIIPAG